MRTVWRITTVRFAQTAFSGEGARLYGGRWNPEGCEVVYTAESQSLALLELMVQDDPLRANYVLIPAQLPDDLPVTRIEADQLPEGWRTIDARDVLQSLGQAWLQDAQTAVLRVPSAVVPAECNYANLYLSVLPNSLGEPISYVRRNRRVALQSGDSLDFESQ